jgi:DNA-binding NarL/FixJ family response regulator
MHRARSEIGRRVLIADDHPLSREGLSIAVRHAFPDCGVLAAGTIAEAERLAGQHSDLKLVILDLMLPDTHGFSGLMRLQFLRPDVPIAIITACRDPELATMARDLGAIAFFSKATSLDQFAEALREIGAGCQVFPATVNTTDSSLLRDQIAQLSQAQRRVLFALADGQANKKIAHDLAVTEATIKAHLTVIFRKLGVTNRLQAMLVLQPLLRNLAA